MIKLKREEVTKKVGHTAKSNKTVVHIQFSVDAWKQIKERAAATGMTASSFVRVASLAACEK